MEWLLYQDALAVLYLQDKLYRLPHTEALAEQVTRLGDPRYAYLLVFPAVFWTLGPSAGLHVILAAALSEWSNIVLKWLLLGNRPYWWAWHHTDWPHLLHQSPATCETGPGNPSGHVMITLVVLLSAVNYVGQRRRKKTRQLVWLTVAAIGLSRVLISSHFLHQILCGLVVGWIIHRATVHSLPHTLTSPLTLTLTALLMVSLALSLFHVWRWIGMDPGFSIPLATRYCRDSQWVRVDTTPLFSLMRAAGTVVGVAFTAALRPLTQHSNSLNSLAGFMISVFLIGCLETVPKATNTTLFYIQSFCMCGMVPVTVWWAGLVVRWLSKQNSVHTICK